MRRPRPPRQRLDADPGYLYTAEAVRLLDWPEIDYAQIRALLRLVRPEDLQPTRKWARYNLRDIASLRVAVDLLGGQGALGPGRRLRIGPLHAACTALRRIGFQYPLLQVPMTRVGRRVVAVAGDLAFEPATGQVVFSNASSELTELLLGQLNPAEVVQLRQRLRTERLSIFAKRTQRTTGTWNVLVSEAQ